MGGIVIADLVDEAKWVNGSLVSRNERRGRQAGVWAMR